MPDGVLTPIERGPKVSTQSPKLRGCGAIGGPRVVDWKTGQGLSQWGSDGEEGHRSGQQHEQRGRGRGRRERGSCTPRTGDRWCEEGEGCGAHERRNTRDTEACPDEQQNHDACLGRRARLASACQEGHHRHRRRHRDPHEGWFVQPERRPLRDVRP